MFNPDSTNIDPVFTNDSQQRVFCNHELIPLAWLPVAQPTFESQSAVMSPETSLLADTSWHSPADSRADNALSDIMILGNAESSCPLDISIPPASLPAPNYRVFNPTITANADGYAMVYRVVDEAHELRRLASCQLTHDFEVVPGSVTPLSDLIKFAAADELDERARQWHADPRYNVLGGKIYLTWNDGGNKPLNHQFILQMDENGLRPAGEARELTREFSRVPTEKNWTLFEHDGKPYATYAICPHEILAMDLSGPRQVICRDFSSTTWKSTYSEIYGVLRGSAAPVRDGDSFLVVAHSSYKSPEGRRYTACFYRFEATAPFRMTQVPAAPFELPNPKGKEFLMPKLNKEVCEVIYPCGFVLEDASAVVSYGINDEACAIARVPTADIRASMEPTTSELTRIATVPDETSDAAPIQRGPRSAVPLFWWDARGKQLDGVTRDRVFGVGNFGDIASLDILQRITSRNVRVPRSNERKLLCIGSVLHTARDGDIVWGTGAKGGKTALDKSVKHLSVHAVRGPLTMDVLRSHKIDTSKIKELFDPGCLLPLVYKGEIDALASTVAPGSQGYRIVPHYKDDLIMRRRDWRHLRQFVSVDATPATFIAKIYGAERVISSSLHGIIFAEALGIPACWLAPLAGEDERKYYDYYYGTGRWAVKRFESVEDALRAEPMPLPRFRFEDYLATFPHEEVAELSSPRIQVKERIQFSKLPGSQMQGFVDQWNFGHTASQGIWATAHRARMQTYVDGCQGISNLELQLQLRPFNPPQFKSPQNVVLTLNGRTRHSIEWANGSAAPVKVALRIDHDGSDRCFVDLLFVARNARSPRSLGISNVEEPLSVCLESILAREAVHVVQKEVSSAPKVPTKAPKNGVAKTKSTGKKVLKASKATKVTKVTKMGKGAAAASSNR